MAEWMTRDEVAEWLRCAPDDIDHALTERIPLPPPHQIGGESLWSVRELNTWYEDRYVPAGARRRGWFPHRPGRTW